MIRPLALLLALIFSHAYSQSWQWVTSVDTWHSVSAMDQKGHVHLLAVDKFHDVDLTGKVTVSEGFAGSGFLLKDAHYNSKGNIVIAGSLQDTFSFKNYTFTNITGREILPAEFNSAGGLEWSKMISGHNDQYLTAMQLDHDDNVLFTAISTGTVAVDGSNYTCRTVGTCLAGKVSPSGKIVWLHTDSSDASQVQDATVSVNKNGESLIFITSKNGAYYHFNNAQLDPGTGTSYYYGDNFILLSGPDGKINWHSSAKIQKWNSCEYAGLTANTYHQINTHFSNGDYYAEIMEKTFAGDTLAMFNGARDTNNFIRYLNIIDSKTYFLLGYWKYLEGGAQHFDNFIYVKEGNTFRKFAGFTGETNFLNLSKRPDGKFVLAGMHIGELKMGDHSVNSGTAWKSFVASIDPAMVELDEIRKTQLRLGRCPSNDHIEIHGRNPNNKLDILDLYGRKLNCPVKGNQIDISNLLPGVYFLRIDRDIETEVYRFIKM